ncbi:hypothetical protein ACEQ8H_004533 [Pleosporales sp. CAS-2024a]
MAQKPASNLVGRARAVSATLANGSPQLGMWQATATAIAQAPNLTELREPETGGSKIEFDEHGHSTRFAKPAENGELQLIKSVTAGVLSPVSHQPEKQPQQGGPRHIVDRTHSFGEKQHGGVKEGWATTILNGLKAFWKFFKTPSGFCITIYFLNIVAWGAMLFFLLLKAAPAMNHPSADDDNSPRKKWIEVDSQILNALFCVTGFGLAPWRLRDWYWTMRVVHLHDHSAMYRLTQQNKGWFRPAPEYEEAMAIEHQKDTVPFNGVRAPPTPLWKLAFVVNMMVLNTALQAVLCYFMWAYNRINRPSWATGTFIGLGCGSAMLAGLMSWWEGRKVKKIEGPEVC